VAKCLDVFSRLPKTRPLVDDLVEGGRASLATIMGAWMLCLSRTSWTQCAGKRPLLLPSLRVVPSRRPSSLVPVTAK
jgi:hypothetical protein